MTSLRKESLVIANALWEAPLMAEMRKVCKKGGDKGKIQLLSRAWQTLEHHCLSLDWDTIDNDNRVALIFDGMLIPLEIIGGDFDGMVKRFEDATRELCPELKWVVKPS